MSSTQIQGDRGNVPEETKHEVRIHFEDLTCNDFRNWIWDHLAQILGAVRSHHAHLEKQHNNRLEDVTYEELVPVQTMLCYAKNLQQLCLNSDELMQRIAWQYGMQISQAFHHPEHIAGVNLNIASIEYYYPQNFINAYLESLPKDDPDLKGEQFEFCLNTTCNMIVGSPSEEPDAPIVRKGAWVLACKNQHLHPKLHLR